MQKRNRKFCTGQRLNSTAHLKDAETILEGEFPLEIQEEPAVAEEVVVTLRGLKELVEIFVYL